jgi:DNA polymerase III subunit beta
MKVTVNRAALTAVLDTTKRVAERKGTMPVLACVRLIAKDGKIELAATDLNVSAVAAIDAAGDAGGALVYAHDLHAAVTKMSTAEVVLRLKDKVFTVKAGRAEQHLPTLNLRDAVKMPGEPEGWVDVPGAALSEVLSGCSASICADETRFHLNGILLITNGKTLRGVSTDGHRMHSVERPAKLKWSQPYTILPRRAVDVVKRITQAEETVQIARDGHFLHVRAGSTTISAKLIDAQFPPWDQVMVEHERASTVNREDLLGALNRAGLVATNQRGVALEFIGAEVRLRTSDPDGRSAEDAIDADGDVKGVTIGFNPVYLIDALAALGGDRVTLRVGGELDPILIHRAGEIGGKAGGDAAVAMPMRV